VPLAAAKEGAIVDIVAFCMRKGKAVRILKEKKVYTESEKGRERSAEAKRYERFRQVHDIHKYFHKITVSVVSFVCLTYHHFISF